MVGLLDKVGKNRKKLGRSCQKSMNTVIGGRSGLIAGALVAESYENQLEKKKKEAT